MLLFLSFSVAAVPWTAPMKRRAPPHFAAPPWQRNRSAAGCFSVRSGCFLRHLFPGNAFFLSFIDAYLTL